MDMQTVIQVSSISKHYGANKAVDKVSFQVRKGELFGIVGTNGAGKTTLLEMMMGLRMPDKGAIHVLGRDVLFEADLLKEDIGIHLQSTTLIDKMNVREALELFQSFYKRKNDLDMIIKQFDLEPYADKIVKRLSGGWRQRTALAIALVNDPHIIFLDEPTTGLDPAAKRDYWSLLLELKRQGKTIVVASHDMEELQRNCNHIAVMRRGEMVACDSPAALISNLPGGGMTMEAVYMHYAVESKKDEQHRPILITDESINALNLLM
ncbi:ABC transporter ATP-binding protein [Paenibacillus harenae]|uniref:ABC-2 type transport system ATP-binding protein n=1 Tax=Paenibacillus harenae TaxID=306543 RepID=A0ABT9UBX6_PAEHA|nr:ABC transporter ATP-binding protein [Paenibacillus harenae]MDQ0115719.1 ABC-2 type transport system ATP-binding protein [Paenibacillus harenae]